MREIQRFRLAVVSNLIVPTAMAILVLWSQPLAAQSFSTIWSFTGGMGGSFPPSGVALDQAGSIYGTTSEGGTAGGNCGTDGCGTVYKLTLRDSGPVLNPLYDFTGGMDGLFPSVRVTFGPGGALYGTTQYGGGGACQPRGCGTVFRLRPPATFCSAVICRWTETVLYRFNGGPDGAFPNGELIFDSAGNIYGTAAGGGTGTCLVGGQQTGCGVVYKLTPSGGNWIQSVLYSFAGGNDGAFPEARVTFDQMGNLYGTTSQGGTANCGTVFQLLHSGSNWTESVLYTFLGGNDGHFPIIGVIFDQAGNLYGGASAGGASGGGTIFQLTPGNPNWAFSVLYSFDGFDFEGAGPGGDLVLRNGSLYGTTASDGLFQAGNVFKLTGSTYTSLHDFALGTDGGNPFSTVVFDTSGNLYGAASFGGDVNACGGFGCGTVWKIIP